MGVIRLVHWHEAEAQAKAERLRAAGYSVDASPLDAQAMKALRKHKPLAVVIDLSRLPSHGRETASALRQSKPTRDVPIIFVGGEEEKVAAVRQALPDAAYTSWTSIKSALKKAIRTPVATSPTTSRSASGSDSAAPQIKKLGIKSGMMLAFVGAPETFVKKLGTLPEGVRWRNGLGGPSDLVFWFVKKRADFDGKFDAVRRAGSKGGLWVMWPKKTSALASDLGQSEIRDRLVEAGFDDSKPFPVDQDWTGMRFSPRK